MTAKVAVVRINQEYSAALQRAIQLTGGLDGFNTPERDVTIKVGIFDPRSRHHTSVGALQSIIAAFDKAPRIYLVESDNYCGKALERLDLCYKDLFSERVIPASLSDDPQARVTKVAGEDMALGHLLFKPNVLVSTHILRTFQMGSVLKNLFGCTPMVQKARFHKRTVFARHQADIYEAAGGFDLTVMDGSQLYHMAAEFSIPTDVLIVGKDPVAVETVGATLAGLKIEKMALIQEFVQRGLGVGSINDIEIVGISPEEFAELKKAPKQLQKLIDAAPKKPGVSDTIDCLTQEGWLDTFRKAEEVVDALKSRGVNNATKELVTTTLKRRVGKTLELAKEGKTPIFRRLQE